ncbi:MAG: M20/M25/M40 family metallo-hydrolase [Gemmatimonadaceae bacterium]
MIRMHMIRCRPMAVLALVGLAVGCRPGTRSVLGVPATPDSALLSRDVAWLADDARDGRAAGTAGNDSARAYLVRRLELLGVDPLIPQADCPGPCPLSFVQLFDARMSGAERHGLPPSLPTGNVVGLIPGRDPALRGQLVVLGAHFDHLGRRSFGSRDTAQPNAIHNGADDNASGVAAVLELARLLRRNPPRRSVAILAFSAEELGTLGSEYLVGHPPFPLDSVQAMLNFDMVGRLRDDKLIVYGTATATELPAILSGANSAPSLKLHAVGDGEGPSDHAAFYHKGLPVLHFFTDLHDDYHRTTDDFDRVNVAGMRRVVAFAERVTRELADRPARLTFVRTPVTATRTGASPRSAGPQASMGTVPDMGAADVPGLRLSGVSPGSPAEKAGLKPGDVVVELAGKAVTDLQSYSDALYSNKPGDQITVIALRGAERLTFNVTLGSRGG